MEKKINKLQYLDKDGYPNFKKFLTVADTGNFSTGYEIPQQAAIEFMSAVTDAVFSNILNAICHSDDISPKETDELKARAKLLNQIQKDEVNSFVTIFIHLALTAANGDINAKSLYDEIAITLDEFNGSDWEGTEIGND